MDDLFFFAAVVMFIVVQPINSTTKRNVATRFVVGENTNNGEPCCVERQWMGGYLSKSLVSYIAF